MTTACSECGGQMPASRKTCSISCRVQRASRVAGEKRAEKAQLERKARERPCGNFLACGVIIDKLEGRFCSNRCAATITNQERTKKSKTKRIVCGSCDAVIYDKPTSERTYCDNRCQANAERLRRVEDWISGKVVYLSGPREWMRKHLFEVRGERCEKCDRAPWNPRLARVMVQVDHIDGIRTNNSIDNFKILCASCHTETETWGRIKRM